MGETLNVEQFKAYLDEVLDGGYGQKHGYTKEQANDVALDFISNNIALIKELKPGRLNQIAGEIQSGRLNTGKNEADLRIVKVLEAIKSAEQNTEQAQSEKTTQSMEKPKTQQENTKDAIVNLISSAKTHDELRRAAKQIEDYDDSYVVTAKQGSADKQLATEAYNEMSRLLKFKKDDLTKMENLLVRMNSL